MCKFWFFFACVSSAETSVGKFVVKEKFHSAPTRFKFRNFIEVEFEAKNNRIMVQSRYRIASLPPMMTSLHCCCVNEEDSNPKTVSLAVAETNSWAGSMDRLFLERFRDSKDGDCVAAVTILVNCSAVRCVPIKETDCSLDTAWNRSSSSICERSSPVMISSVTVSLSFTISSSMVAWTELKCSQTSRWFPW